MQVSVGGDYKYCFGGAIKSGGGVVPCLRKLVRFREGGIAFANVDFKDLLTTVIFYSTVFF